MRIAFLTTEYPTEKYFAGGLSSYLYRTATALVRKGHQPEIFTLSDNDERFWHDSVYIHRVKNGFFFKDFIRNKRLIWRYGGYADVMDRSLKLARAIRQRHRESPFDIVQATDYLASGLVATMRKVAPVVTRISGYRPLWMEADRRAFTKNLLQCERAEIFQIRMSSGAYAPSRYLVGVYEKERGMKIDLIEPPFYLDENILSPEIPPDLPDRGSFGLFFGEIGFKKGCDRLLRVLPDLLERYKDMGFIFIGRIRNDENGQPFDLLIKRKLERYIGRVVVLPPCKQSHLFHFVKNARFVVLPSRVDNLPNTLMEAMALKRIVIGTHDASFDQFIQHGVNGFLVSQNDDDELLRHMDLAWNMDEEIRLEMGESAAKSLERIRPDEAIENLISFYRKVILRSRRS